MAGWNNKKSLTPLFEANVARDFTRAWVNLG